MAARPTQFVFHTKEDSELHRALMKLRSDPTRAMSRIIVQVLESALRRDHPDLFNNPSPSAEAVPVPITNRKPTRK